MRRTGFAILLALAATLGACTDDDTHARGRPCCDRGAGRPSALSILAIAVWP